MTLGGDTDQTLAIFSKSNDGRGGTGTLSVLDHTRGPGLQSGDTGVGGTQINTNDGVFSIREGALGKKRRARERGLTQEARAEQSTTRQHGSER